MKELYELRDKLCDELKQYGKKEMSAGSLDVIDKLAHTIKNVDKIIENGNADGYSGDYMGNVTYRNSRRGADMRDGRYSADMVGRSYRRGRDAMGRYVSRDGYSYDGDMVSELKELMDEAQDDRTKQKFKRFIAEIESM